jgi:3-keto-disaccharide hydrolase
MRPRFCSLVALMVLASASAAGSDKPIVPFNGEDLTGWKFKGAEEKSHWNVARSIWVESMPKVLALGSPLKDGKKVGDLVNFTPGGVDLYTEQKFGDCLIELEFLIPKDSNSGVYVMGEYEVQILDSYGKEKVGPGDMGGIYNTAAPNLNASKKPGEWQKFVIDFRAPRFEGDKKTANARFIKVVLNDQVIHENVEVKGPTPSCLTGKEAPTGPLMLQGDHGPVAFRNIKITPKTAK